MTHRETEMTDLEIDAILAEMAAQGPVPSDALMAHVIQDSTVAIAGAVSSSQAYCTST